MVILLLIYVLHFSHCIAALITFGRALPPVLWEPPGTASSIPRPGGRLKKKPQQQQMRYVQGAVHKMHFTVVCHIISLSRSKFQPYFHYNETGTTLD